MNLSKEVVLISGAFGLIGESFCEAILKNGGKIVLADINQKPLKKLAKKYNYKNILFKKINVNNTNQLDKLIVEGNKKFGKINAAIHCSYPRSKNWGKIFEKVNLKDLSYNLTNQLGGTIIFSQRIIKHFLKQKRGNLILISSIQGLMAPKFEHYVGTKMTSPIEYSAIKSGVLSITSYLAKYYKNKGIRINCISPGGIKDNQPKKFVKKYNKTCASKGLLDARDLEGALLFLLSEGSKYINGQNIVVDDGWSL